MSLEALKSFLRRLVRPSVDDCVQFAHKAIARLERVSLRHQNAADDKRAFAIRLGSEADAHDEQYLLALRLQGKLLDIVR